MTTSPFLQKNPQLSGIFQNINEADQNKIVAGWSGTRTIVSFRVNPLKSEYDEMKAALDKASIPFTAWDLWPAAFIIDKEHEYALRGLDIYKD